MTRLARLLRLASLALIALIALIALTTAAPAHASSLDLPIRVDADGIVVRAERGMDHIAERVARSAAEELASIYIDLDGLRRPPKIEIRLVSQTEDIARVAPHPGVPPWAVGVAFSSEGIVVAAHRRGGEMLDIDNTVAHELAHLALGAALGGRAPRWLNEGFAYLHSSDWSFARFRTLVGMAWSNNVIELHELDRSFPRGEQAAHRAYAQSYDFAAFLARRGRYSDREDDGNPLPFRRFLAAIGGGKSPTEAAEIAFGARLHELFAEWRSGLRARYLLVPAEMFGLAVWIFGAFILVIAFFKRRRQNRAILARWEIEERGEAAEPAVNPDSGDASAAVSSGPSDSG